MSQDYRIKTARNEALAESSELLERLTKKLVQLPGIPELMNNVTASDQLPPDKKLRKGRPVGISRKRLADVRIGDDIDCLERLLGRFKDLHGCR